MRAADKSSATRDHRKPFRGRLPDRNPPMNAADAFTNLRRRRPTVRIQIITPLTPASSSPLIAAVLVGTSVLFKTRNILVGESQTRAPVGGGALAQHATTVPPVRPRRGAVVCWCITADRVRRCLWLAAIPAASSATITATAQEISATENLHRRLSLDGPRTSSPNWAAPLTASSRGSRRRSSRSATSSRNASHEATHASRGQRTLLQVALADPRADAESLRRAARKHSLSQPARTSHRCLLTLASASADSNAPNRSTSHGANCPVSRAKKPNDSASESQPRLCLH